MAFDEELAGRVRSQQAGQKGLAEKKMFGGLADDAALAKWLGLGKKFAASLPKK
ncbi:MAG: hypothetical protein ABI728_06100 [Betaproteobacteria bacterium]